MPDTCLTESKEDELVANEVGQNGVETLPEELQDRYQALIGVAELYGRDLALDVDDIFTAFLLARWV